MSCMIKELVALISKSERATINYLLMQNTRLIKWFTKIRLELARPSSNHAHYLFIPFLMTLDHLVLAEMNFLAVILQTESVLEHLYLQSINMNIPFSERPT